MQSIRVVCVDSYQATPIPDFDPIFSQFRGSDIKQVPVLRIFGINLIGEKVCLHVHGVFPYMYVPYTGHMNPDILSYRLAEALDAGLNVSLGSASSKTQHVYKVKQVSGIPFYGYHKKKHHFFKIYFYNPAMIRKATDLFYSGSILDQVYQPHEAHIPYTIQFMIDYNIYGMSTINLNSVRYRYSSSIAENEANTQNFDNDKKKYMPFSVVKQSICQIEIDAWASDIVNRNVIDKGIDLNPGIAAIWEEEKCRRAKAGLGGDSQLTYPESPRRSQAAQNFMTDSDLYHQARLAHRLCMLESQGDDSSLSLSADNTSYPVQVPDDSNLLNASQLEIHVGPIDSSNVDESLKNNETKLSQSQASFENLSLSISDLDLVDMLVNMNQENDNETSQIDENSILGSQRSQKNFPDFPLERDKDEEEEEEEENEEVPDLNLTTVDLDTINLCSWETIQEKSQLVTQNTNESHMELVLESLNEPLDYSNQIIPQLDGPIDDENTRSNPSSVKKDDRGLSRNNPRTPSSKRKRILSSSDDDIDDDILLTRKQERLPKTPRRTPTKRSDGKISSPSCPTRTYSPLSVEVSLGQKTPKRTNASPSARTPTRRISRLNSSRKRIFSPVKEVQCEASSSETSNDRKSKTSSDELFTTDMDTNDSDATLVGDSDDSLNTVVPLPPEKAVIINDSDSNETIVSSKEKSIFPPKELSFSELVAIKEKHLNITSKIKEDKPLKRVNPLPFFSDQDDADAMARYPLPTGALYRAKGPRSKPLSLDDIPDWRRTNIKGFLKLDEIDPNNHDLITITQFDLPPSSDSVVAYFKNRKKNEEEKENKKETKESQKSDVNETVVDSPFDLSIYNSFGFQNEQPSRHLGVSCGQIEFTNRTSPIGKTAHENLGSDKALTNYQFLTILCLEVHVMTRPNLLPDSRYDPIAAIFYAIHNDVPPDWTKTKPLECGVIIVDPSKTDPNFSDRQQQALNYVDNEDSLFASLISIIERCDPEILIGWDLETLSWGYVFQRASILGKNLSGKVSRIPSAKCNWETTNDQATQELHIETLAEVKLPGRIVLDVWRIMRYEIALTSYTYENVMYNVMNERVPHYNFDLLTNWWNNPTYKWRVIDHYTNKIIGVHRLLHHLDIINRTSEHARLYGIQFYEVFSRGSQFRVESMMLRLAKPLNYIPVSPSSHQRGCMRAPESLPLIMEPESTMYTDPVVVLDFQSLYPSIIIAYNYCFSTCLGRIDHIGASHPYEFGTTSLKVPKNLAQKLQKQLNYAPCGVAYVKKEIREGILPRMLMEILDTRLMVKKAIKDHPKDDRGLQRALHSRQLGLKLIANVTYGYTAANFSGRMPCIEVGDSVVSKGKETLERAIKIVDSTKKWGARVIYGDTDSLFVLLEGKTKEEAFKIGNEIADVVTATNPKPVKLKFEKVMMPCILQTKKRYCGYMYENLNDKPVYLAKGIETVRRDGCPAGSKILEKSLRILFDTNDLSQVKEYVTRQLDKILTGRASIQDLTFAKEFRGIKGYKAAACVPALELTKRLVQKDPKAVPRRGSRVPYIIVAGGPNEPLIRCVRSPMEVIKDPGLRPNAVYYITKVIIPPLNRCLNLIGVDAFVWYMEMPHRQALNRLQGMPLVNNNRKQQKTTISQYLCNTTCPCCGRSCDKGICADCIKNKTHTLVVLFEKCRHYERIHTNIIKMCESCIGVMDAKSCTSLDCPLFYRRMQAQKDSTQIPHIYDLIYDLIK